MESVLVVDVGTSNLRIIVFTLDGRIAAQFSRPYSPVFLGGVCVEQDPGSWEEALSAAAGETGVFLAGHKNDVLAIVIASQRASVIPVDGEGHPLRPALMWQDKRSTAECEAVVRIEDPYKLYRRTGLRMDPYFSAPKMAWLKRMEPGVYSAAQKMLGVQDYVAWLLTGVFVTDHTQASRTYLMDLKTFRWDEGLAKLWGIDSAKLPDLIAPGSVAGALTGPVKRLLGLADGIPVVLAGGDQQCAALALGVIEHGKAAINSGTGSFLLAYADHPVFHPEARTLCSAAAIPGRWVAEGGLLTSGVLYDWMRERLFGELDTHRSIEAMEEEASASPPGSGGVLLLPHWKGAAAPYWNPRARGVIFGLGAETTRGDLARAALEGMALETAENARNLEPLVGRFESVASAGGMSKSRLYNRIQADCLDRPVLCLENREATAIGALISALVAIRAAADVISAYHSLAPAIKERLSPVAENVAFYSNLKEMRSKLYYAIEDAMYANIAKRT